MSDDTIKDALKMMPYGFYSFTTKNGADVNAMVVNWVSQMSYEPRLIAVGIQKSCYSRGLVEAGRVFGLNIFLQADSDAIMPVTSGRSQETGKDGRSRLFRRAGNRRARARRRRRLHRMQSDADCRCRR